MNRPWALPRFLSKEIFSIIKTINEEGTTVLLVEQNANMALSIADYAYVLETGRITLSGPRLIFLPVRPSARPTWAAKEEITCA